MNKKQKAELLAKFAIGKINKEQLKSELEKDNSLKVIIWDEFEPGLFRDENGNLFNPDKPREENVWNITIRNFNADGTPCPEPAISEKEVADRIALEE